MGCSGHIEYCTLIQLENVGMLTKSDINHELHCGGHKRALACSKRIPNIDTMRLIISMHFNMGPST